MGDSHGQACPPTPSPQAAAVLCIVSLAHQAGEEIDHSLRRSFVPSKPQASPTLSSTECPDHDFLILHFSTDAFAYFPLHEHLLQTGAEGNGNAMTGVANGLARTTSVTSQRQPRPTPSAVSLLLWSEDVRTAGTPRGAHTQHQGHLGQPNTFPSLGHVRTCPVTWPRQHRSAGSCVPGPWPCPRMWGASSSCLASFPGGQIFPPQPSPPGFPKVIPSQNSCMGSPKPST